jgi:short-subunit dehydrogenase
MAPDRILRALVTGASAGLGAGFVGTLAARGVETVVVARRADRLHALAVRTPTDTEVLVADLATETGRARVCDRLASTDRPVDLLVNAAGFGAYGDVASTDASVLDELVAVNVTALTACTRAVLPQLLERGVGGVVNVGSTAGYQPGPGGAAYAASKAYVRSFTEPLHEELAGTPVHAMLLAPGFTETEFQRVAGVAPDAMPAFARGQVDEVVAAGLDAFARGRAVCVPGAVNRLTTVGSQLTPSVVSRKVAGVVHDRFRREA